MSAEYDKKFDRTKAVLTSEYRKALGPAGISALYDAVMIMTFEDGEVCDEETRFLHDFSEFLGTKGSDGDLTPDALLERISGLSVSPLAAEAFVKVLLVVCDLDDDVGTDEMKLWAEIARCFGISSERQKSLRGLLRRARATPHLSKKRLSES